MAGEEKEPKEGDEASGDEKDGEKKGTEQQDKKPDEAGKDGDARALTKLEIMKRDVMAICPRGLESVAENYFLEDKAPTLEKARDALKAAVAERSKPVGTTDTGVETGGEKKGEGDKGGDGAKDRAAPEKKAVKRAIFS